MRLPSSSRLPALASGSPRGPRGAAALLAAAIVALLLVLVAPGCGRSSLELETAADGGGPVGNCGPSTCPSGCCDANGACRTGGDTRACGSTGQRCSDCIANGFQSCDVPRGKVCARTVANCGASTCSGGCCSTTGGTSTCLAGSDPSACGRSGAFCTDCGSEGRACDPVQRACSAGKCDASNCSGCCVGDKCLIGDETFACGTKGDVCASCADTGQLCKSTPGGGGQCVGTPTCGPQNCGGCCNGNICVSGSDGAACGKQGQACANCTASGKQCIPQGQPNERTCQTVATCNAGNCPGCCVGNSCVVATTPAACGKGGQVCKGCALNETCSAGLCTPQANCGPGNCNGCCIGADICAVGSQNTACGVAGAQCTNCAGVGQVCQGGACQAPVCGPGNCAGCCSGNTCVLGTQDNACGQKGAQCNDCTPVDQVCQGRQCRAKCSPATCTGCCTKSNACALGFTNSACGSGGAACLNCTAGGSTCDALVAPRVCANQQNTCPAAYPSCPVGVTTGVTPALQNQCDDVAELDALQAACSNASGGADGAACLAAFQVLAANNAACATCLTPFRQPFQQLSGIYLCAAPVVTIACNRATGCAVDCQGTSCNQCPAASVDPCISQVDGNNGQCNPYIQQTACVLPALAPGSLCSPATYSNDFGRWLRGVGDHFCGNGP